MSIWQRVVIVLGVLAGMVAGGHAAAGAGHTGGHTEGLEDGAVDVERLDAFVSEQVDRAGIPGVAYAVVGPEGVEHQSTMGEDGDGEPVTSATPFLWGSVAKPVTAALVMELVESGELDLDARVTTYVPEFAMADSAAEGITVRHLLSQTSGIPERMDLTDRDDADRRHGDAVRLLADVHLAADVGEEHLYSSLNYMLLGAVVEEVTGHEFADVLRERLLEPTGMDTAITDADDAAERLPPGHRYVLGRARAFRTGFDAAGVSSGYLGGSLDDAVAFAQAHLDGSSLLSAEQRSTLVHPEVSTGDDRSYGLGWRTWQVFGSEQDMVWHSGAAPGFQASIVLLPAQERAVVVLQNVYGSFQETQLLDTSWGLASLLSGAEPETHGVEPMYVVVLAALVILCLGLVAALSVSVWRLARPSPARSPRGAFVRLGIWWAGLLVVGGGLLALPGWFGVTLDQVALWAPDVAALLYAGLVLAGLLGLSRLAVTMRMRGTSS